MRSLALVEFTPKRTSVALYVFLLIMLAFATLIHNLAFAEQPPPPCHPNLLAKADMATVKKRGDIRHLPQPLEDRLV
jgi:hypothetical protein